MHDLLGTAGTVTIPIPVGGLGEVVLFVRGGSEAYAAHADVAIAKHTRVVVIDQTGPRSVAVTPTS